MEGFPFGAKLEGGSAIKQPLDFVALFSLAERGALRDEREVKIFIAAMEVSPYTPTR